MNLARAVRVLGDGGQEGRHLALPKKGYGPSGFRGTERAPDLFCTCQKKGYGAQSPPGFWRDHGQSMSAQDEIRSQKMMKSVNLARAVRILGDGGQEGRYLAKQDKLAEFKTACFKCENDHIAFILFVYLR